MYAIIRTGGHQEKVTVGEQITVDRLKREPGETVPFVPLMIGLDDGTIVTDHRELAERAAVVGRVLQHVKGDKVDVFQYRPKTNYRRHVGHRQPLTLVEIAELRFGETVERIEDKRAAEEAQRQALELERQARQEAAGDEPKKVVPKKAASKKKAAAGGAARKPSGAARKPAAKPAAGKGPAGKRA